MYFSGNKNFKLSFHVFYGFFLGGIEPILGSLSPAVSGDASNVEDNNSCMYSRSFVFGYFFDNPTLRHLRKNLFVFLFPIFCCGLSVT